MNFDDAIMAHSAWKMKLTLYIAKPDKSLDHNVVCKDNVCDLGKWIYSDGEKNLASDNEFKKLKKNHADFHLEAGSIIKRADAKENVSEEIMLGSNSKFSKLSLEVVTSLMAMKRIYGK